MSTAKRIGGDWVESIDPNTGKKYYANLKTKVTSWHFPAELKGQKSSASQGTWVERQDPRSGRVYYLNLKTKETTWDEPPNVAAKASSTLKDKDEWLERVDQKTGRKYYINPVTRESRWNKPGAMTRSSRRLTEDRASTGAGAEASAGAALAASGGDAGDLVDAEEEERSPAPQPTARPRVSMRLGAAGAVRKPAQFQSNSLMTQREGREEDEGADDEDEDDAAPKRRSRRRSSRGSAGSGGGGGGGGGGGKEDRFAKLRALREKREGKGPPTDRAAPEENDLEEAATALGLEALTEDVSTEAVPFHDFHEYVNKFFNMKRKGFLGKTTTPEKVMNWKKDVIRTSLHSLNDPSLSADAVQIFKNIVCYMGDRESGKKSVNHCEKILSLTVHAPEELRDELYCQLIKQTRRNPRVSSTVRGWQLMAICAGTYPPSKKLEPYLLSYCHETASGTSVEPNMRIYPETQPYAKYALTRLQKSLQLGPRREVPTDVEIAAAKERQPVVQRVYLLDRHYRTVPVEAWTTVAELNAMVARKLGIQDPTPFSTYEVSSNDEERVLEDDERVLDVLAIWKREHDNAKRKRDAHTFTFVYKMRLFFDIPDDDEAAVNLAYMQAVHDVTDSRYPCSEQDCITLAAMQAQEKHGDFVADMSVLRGNLHEYLPAKFLRSNRDAELEEAIVKVYTRLEGYSSNRAKQGYLDFVKSWQIYGSAYFFVEPQNSRDFPADVVLAVNAKGVLVVDPETKDFLAEYPYSEVVTWGHSAQTFVLVIGNLIRQTKIYFKTDQGTEINSLVHAYVNKLLET